MVTYNNLLGSDEVGRGCIAGLLFVQASCCPQRKLGSMKSGLRALELLTLKSFPVLKLRILQSLLLVKDFLITRKKLGLLEKKNYYFYKNVNPSISLSVAVISVNFIGKHNVLQSSLHGMKQAGRLILKEQEKFPSAKIFWTVDGNKVWRNRESESIKVVPVIQGDSKIPVIGAASIIAKNFRDKLMTELSENYQGYGFERNFGYPTKLHREGIRKFGICDIHRQSFQLLKE